MIKEGQQVRRYYQKRLPSDTSKDYYFIHRNTGVTEPLLIEYGFLDNINDANYLKQNYKRLGEAVVRAISEYKNYNYEPPTDEKTYIVQKGDSLYSIARKFGTTVDSLKNLNSLLNDNLKIGQILIISNNKNQLYIVGNGDSLYSIANKYNTTVNDIKTLNNLTSNILQLGQQLLIPNKETTIKEEIIDSPLFDTYIVQKGDSLYSIANKYNTTIDKLKDINKLTSNMISIGQQLIISEPTIEETLEEEFNNNAIVYIVESGDSLYSIANKYNTTVNDIKTLNNLTSNILQLGQQLLINNNANNNYIVQKGDSLYSIANKYNTTVNDIKTLNNLNNNILTIGQSLKLE